MEGVSLSGTFSTMPFPDLMQWLGDSRRSGILTVALEFEERYLRIEEGRLVALGSDDARSHDLVRLLLARKLIDEPRLRRALHAAETSGRSLRKVLIDDGHVPGAALAGAVRSYAKDTALQLFLWHDGRFFFADHEVEAMLPQREVEAAFPVDPPLPMRELLIDGMRRLDEWRRVAQVLASDYTVVHALGPAPDLLAHEALRARGEPAALGDLCLELGRPRFEVMEELYAAFQRGLLAVDGVPQQMRLGPRHRSPADMLVQNAVTLLDEKQFEEAAVLLRSVLDLDPYHDRARVLLHRARAEQLEELYLQFPPFRVPRCRIPRDGSDPKAAALTPKERYLLSRIDGQRDVGALTVMTPLGELETLRLLKKLSHIGVVAV
jgi:uncharacterized protein DUF4388